MKLLETYVEQKGIFYALLQELDECPFITDENYINLDNLYYYEHSGDKKVNIVLKRLLEINKDEEHPIDAALETIAKMCITLYYSKWSSLYNSMIVSNYNPLDNYSKTKKSKRSTNTNMSNDDTAEMNAYGFDTVAEDGVPKNKNHSETIISGDAEDNYVDFNSSEVGRDGKYSAQELLEKEFEVKKTLFYNIVMADIDKMMAIRIYDPKD